VATIAEAYEDEHGLFMRCEFHSTQAAQDARTVVRGWQPLRAAAAEAKSF
jgi:hypothetical protein